MRLLNEIDSRLLSQKVHKSIPEIDGLNFFLSFSQKTALVQSVFSNNQEFGFVFPFASYSFNGVSETNCVIQPMFVITDTME
jgi:hypothetical protein